MRPVLDFDDAGAKDDEPTKGVLVGDIREWHDEIKRLRLALRIFVGCAYPVAKEINPRGHDWRDEGALDFALSEAKSALSTSR